MVAQVGLGMFEDVICADADVLHGYHGELSGPHGQRKDWLAGLQPGTHLERDQVLKIECRGQEGHRNVQVLEGRLPLAFAIKHRYHAVCLETRDSMVVIRHSAARIFSRRPNDMLDLCFGCRFCVDSCMRLLFVRREVVPKERNAKSTVSTCHGVLHLLFVVNVTLDNFSTQAGEALCHFRVSVSGHSTNGKRSLWIPQDCTDQRTPLSAGCSEHCNDLQAPLQVQDVLMPGCEPCMKCLSGHPPTSPCEAANLASFLVVFRKVLKQLSKLFGPRGLPLAEIAGRHIPECHFLSQMR
mmetsp:Transcript_27011/g.62872  ORF Transcript_27011/g.62872 Transcript_27011/m.62872 type:complete len:297 (+) Transcript_27011:566-1456(+)